MRKKRMWNMAADLFQPLGANMPGLPLVELMGNCRMLIENHRGLVCYDTKEVCVKVKGGMLRVTGRDMTVCNMTACALVIKGHISSLECLEGTG